MDKAALLSKLTADWSRFAALLEGVPQADFDLGLVERQPTIKEICAFLTAWDGEALRRLDYFRGQRLAAPEDLYNEGYWAQWAEKQVAIKLVMSSQGMMVDMIGTRQRLLSQLSETPDFHVERWLAADPQASQPYFDQYLAQASQWRTRWDELNPPLTGLKKWWQTLRTSSSRRN